MEYALPNNRKFIIEPCENNFNPRHDDNLSTMVCFHNKYDLGDKHNHEAQDYYSLQKRKDVIVLPLYLYDHSGITMNTTGFSCRFDSGQVGFVYITNEKIRKEYNVKRVTAKLRKKVEQLLINEVEVYDQYLTGDVYQFTIIKIEGNEHEDSCAGFYGDDVLSNGMLDNISNEDSNHLKLTLNKKEVVLS